jgi:putative FmdB family regulatory protein
MLRPAHRAVCRRGDDFCNPRVQVYGCWERHGLPPFIVDPTPNLQIPGGPQAFRALSTYMKELCAEHRPVNRIASTNVCSCNSANGAWTEEGAVPHYEYLCSACSKKFSIVLTLAEHEKGQVKCPKCGSTKVEQQWAAFYATTSKKS